MEEVSIRRYEPSDQADVIRLWELCDLTRAWNDPYLDIARKLTVQPGLFLVLETGEIIIGTIMGAFDGHRGVVNYLAIHPDHKKMGYGKLLMDRIERDLESMGCPKINLMVRNSNLDVQAFYEALGYEEQDVKVYGKRLIAD